MPMLTTAAGVEIFYRDRGVGQPIMVHHGWPLSADEWEPQLHFFLDHVFRVIAHDRRGHGRSSHVGHGHDLDHYATDVAAVVAHLGLRDVIHVGHSLGGGKVSRYVAGHGAGRVAKVVLAAAAAPHLLRTDIKSPRSASGGLRRLPRRRRGRPLAVQSRRSLRALLRVQPARRGGLPGNRLELVAPGHGRGRQG